jgi:hypothetical protein
VASLDALLLSTYGRLLLVKIALVALALGVAAVVRRSLGAGVVRVPVLRLEALALLAVLGVAGAVASSRPALGTEWTPRSQVQPIASSQVDDVVQTLDIKPNLPGRNFVTVDAYQTRRPAPGEIQQVSVTFQGTARASTAYLRPEGNGRWVLATDVLDAPGTWHVTVRVQRANVAPTTAGYDWTVGDPQARLAAPVVSAAPLRPWTDGAGLAAGLALLAAAGVAVLRRRPPGPAVAPLPRPADDATSPVPAPAGPPRTESMEPQTGDDERDAVRS